jgi:hypothetical protein
MHLFGSEWKKMRGILAMNRSTDAYRWAKEKAELEVKSSGMEDRMKGNEEQLKDLEDKLQAGEIAPEDFKTLSTKLLQSPSN